MIEIINSYYIYTLSNDLIMNMNRKNHDHFGGDYNKRFKQGHYGGDYNKRFNQGHYSGDYNKGINQGHYGGNRTIDLFT